MSIMLPWTAMFTDGLPQTDGAMARLIAQEEERNAATVNLIASESYCPKATVEAEASTLVNKNATGYPGNRDVSGCAVVNEIEILAQARARALFQTEHANVQAVSSTIANIAVLRALLKPGDRILSLEETAGGHHSHGAAYHVSGRDYAVTPFGPDEATGGIDLEAVRKLAKSVRPNILIAGSTAYPRAIDFPGLQRVATEMGALFFADIAHVSGLVATGLHVNPCPTADVVTTSTHKTLCGPRTGGVILSKTRHAQALDDALFPGMQGAPGAHIFAARAVLFDIVGRPPFKALMTHVVDNAAALAAALRAEGLPLYLGGTDTHMVVVDLRGRTVDGLAAERRLETHGILANRVGLTARPGDRGKAGIRIGAVAMTIRGLGAKEFRAIASAIARLLADVAGPRDDQIARDMAALAHAHPVPPAVLLQSNAYH